MAFAQVFRKLAKEVLSYPSSIKPTENFIICKLDLNKPEFFFNQFIVERYITAKSELQMTFGFLIPLPYVKIETNWLFQFIHILKPLSLRFGF